MVTLVRTSLADGTCRCAMLQDCRNIYLELARLSGVEVALNDTASMEVVQHAAHDAGDGQLAVMCGKGRETHLSSHANVQHE